MDDSFICLHKIGTQLCLSLYNALLSMYFHVGNDTEACIIFEDTEAFLHDHATYDATIVCLVSNGRDEKLTKYKQMFAHIIQPTELALVSVISSYSSATIGNQVYIQAIKLGHSFCTSVSNAAITTFANWRKMEVSQIFFQRL